jgi:hypothetical protein
MEAEFRARWALPAIWIALLAMDFWLPQSWLLRLHLASQTMQICLCGLTAAIVIGSVAFGDYSESVERVFKSIALLTLGLLLLAGLLELSQLLTYSRHARLSDFAVNAVGVIIASVLMLETYREKHRRRIEDQIHW